MGRWDKYKVSETAPVSTSSTNKWDKYKIPIEPVKKDAADSWPTLIGKSALKGLMSIGDIPKVGAQLSESYLNSSMGNRLPGVYGLMNPGIQSLEEIPPKNANGSDIPPRFDYSKNIPSMGDVRKGIKKYTNIDLEPRPEGSAQRIVAHGAEFGASMTPWGLIGKGANLASKVQKATNLTKGATGVGLTSGTLQEVGADPLVADLAGSVISPLAKPTLLSGFRKGKELAVKAPMKLMGLHPERFNLEAARAARDLGIELPAAVLTDNKLTTLADQAVSKTPIFGNVLKDKYDRAQEQTFKNLGNIYNEVGPIKTPEVEKRIYDLYEKRKSELPVEAAIKPSHTVDALDSIKINSALPSKPERELLGEIQILRDELNPTLKSKMGDIKIPIQDYSVDRLIGTKQSLNNIIKWDLDEGVKNQLRRVQKAISKDIEEYGKTNPKWYKSFKDADNLFAKTAKREKVETLLRNEGVSGNPEELSYAMLSRSINDKNKRKLLEKHTSSETFEKIKKLGVVSQAMVQKNRRVLNPSGTAPTVATLAYLTKLYTNPMSTISFTGIGGIGGTFVASKLLTDKKFLDLALKYAEDKGKDKLLTEMKLNKRMKEVTGYTSNSLYRELARENNEADVDGLQ